jgi:hypothetical protein
MPEPPEMLQPLRVSSNLSAGGASHIQRAVAPGCANRRARRRQVGVYTRAGDDGLGASSRTPAAPTSASPRPHR